jgi:hypothetical protein
MRHILAYLLFFVFVTTASLSAQSYDAAFGVRLGTDWGMTGQLRMPVIHKNFAVEGIIQSSFQREEAALTLLGKQHYPLLSRRLNVFLGGGAHIGWNTASDETQTYDNPFGLDLAVGAELTLGRFNVSYDFKPAFNLVGGERTVYSQSGISVRYVVAKRNDIYDKKTERQRNQRRKKRAREKRRADRDPDWWKVWKQS